MKSLALGILAICCVFAAESESLLLRNGTVHPVSGPEIGPASVLIQDGKIAAVGRGVRAPRGARVIDVKGLHVYPGMIDSATQVGLSEIGSVKETSDVTEIADFSPQLRSLIAINPASDHIPVARANGLTSVIALPAGGIVSGQAALVHLDGWTWEEMRIRGSAAMHVQFPTIQFRPSRGRPRPSDAPKTFKEAQEKYQEQLRQLDEFFEHARRYERAKSAGAAGFQPDVKYEAMIPVLKRELPVVATAIRRREIRAVLDFAGKQSIRLILARPRQVQEFLPELKEKDIPVVLGPTLALPLEEDDPYDSSYALPAEIHQAGVRIAFATFSSSNSGNLPYQAAMAVAFGLPQEVALRAVTLSAAEIWGVAEELGSIEVGKVADLIITDGDPLETRTQIKILIINGREVDPAANKHYRLYQEYKDRK